MISLDTETTGKDFRHGTQPYIVTSCNEDDEVTCFEWDVDPVTRRPVLPPGDLDAIIGMVDAADGIVLQNAKFDIMALSTLDSDFGKNWPWEKTFDTIIAGHLLSSNSRHNLTDMLCQSPLRYDITKYEEAVKDATNKARRLARSKYPTWAIAKEGREDMPSAKETVWKADMWLPKALWKASAQVRKDCPDWETVTANYANTDSSVTLPLWKWQKQEIERRGLWKFFVEGMKVAAVVYRMEDYGVTISLDRLNAQRDEYLEAAEKAERVCVGLAATLGVSLTLPKSGSNKSLLSFCFADLELPVTHVTDNGNPSICKEALDAYELTLPEKSLGLSFIKNLKAKRERDTAVGYMATYEKFAVPVCEDGKVVRGWYRVHPSLNQTGTDTLRFSSSNPNEQSISKKKGFNLRESFGPRPGREWWSADAQNIELRLPAYESGEEAMIALFERPNDAPYFGSNHLLVAHVLHKRMFEECLTCKTCSQEIKVAASVVQKDSKFCNCGVKRGFVDGRVFKKRYEATWYKWIKNGNFAVQYGAVESSGTADRAYHVPGGQKIVQARFTKQADLNRRLVAFANKYGYVETIPDKTVDPTRGYPIMCTQVRGGVLPTVPLNYHIQGTAMWWMRKGMVRCQMQLDEWRKADGFDGHIVLQVHDELVFDFPKGKRHPKEDLDRKFPANEKKVWMGGGSNLWRIRTLRDLMAKGGDDIGIPTPVSCEYHEVSWAEGMTV